MKYLGKITDNKDLVTKEYVDSHHDSTKQDILVSGTNIKTINNQSLLGSGNISVGGGTGSTSWGNIGGTLSNQTDLQTALDNKMDKTNPTGTGAFSLNRKANTTIGDYSFAEGGGTTASGRYSHAEGDSTTASGNYSHAEGGGTTASSPYSHAEGYMTIANLNCSHVQGKWNAEDTNGIYADIVGNGTASSERSNAYALSWDGTGHYAGDVYVGCNADSTGGTKLAKLSDIRSQFKVVTYSEHSSKSVSTTGASATHDISEPGYYPLGVVGFYVSNANVLVRACYLNNVGNGSATINYYMRSVSGTNTVTQTTRVLWVKI